MKEALVSGLNEWLLNTRPDDRRYKEMSALRDLIQEEGEGSILFEDLTSIANKPRPVAKGFAFDFELNEAQAEQVEWALENAPEEEKWLAVLKQLTSFVAQTKHPATITYGESGGPYAPDED